MEFYGLDRFGAHTYSHYGDCGLRAGMVVEQADAERDWRLEASN